jgi:hypothetical protein
VAIVDLPGSPRATRNGTDLDYPRIDTGANDLEFDDFDDIEDTDIDTSPLMLQIAYGAALLIVFVIGAASMILSFHSQTDMGVRARYPHRLAPLLPVIIDGTIVLSTLAILALRRQKHLHRDKLRYFWWTLGVSAFVSMGTNGLELFLPTGQPLPPWLAAAYGVLPPLSLLADTHGAALLASVRPSTLRPQSRQMAAVRRRMEQNRRLYWAQIAQIMLDENPNSKVITERPVEVLADVLYRHHENQESGRKISAATGVHHQTLKKILAAADTAQRASHRQPARDTAARSTSDRLG